MIKTDSDRITRMNYVTASQADWKKTPNTLYIISTASKDNRYFNRKLFINE